MSAEPVTEPDVEELVLPGLVGKKEEREEKDKADKVTGQRLNQLHLGDDSDDDLDAEDDEDLENVVETITERLMGLTEMVPDRAWNWLGRSYSFSYWLLRRSLWVVGTSVALLALPPFIEWQRMEMEESMNMQKKQIMLGQGAMPGPGMMSGSATR